MFVCRGVTDRTQASLCVSVVWQDVGQNNPFHMCPHHSTVPGLNGENTVTEIYRGLKSNQIRCYLSRAPKTSGVDFTVEC